MKRADSPNSSEPDDALSNRALAWMRHAGTEADVLHEIARRVRRQRSRRLALGGALAAAVVLAAVVFLPSPPSARPSSAAATLANQTTNLVRPALQTLADGSIVELKDDAQIRVDFDTEFRRVTLVRGEAHFQVAKNPARPFVVRAGQVEVRAVGTAFSVQVASAKIDVIVTEGTVRVAPEGASAAAGSTGADGRVALVDAGRRCVIEADLVPQLRDVSRADADERLAWRIPQLEFSRTPLPEVIAAMNRHAAGADRIALEIADPALNQIKLTGFLRADNVEGLLGLLRTNFGVAAERTSAHGTEAGVIRLTKTGDRKP